MLKHFEVPEHMHRNHQRAIAGGYERTGELLIELAMQRMGLETLEHSDVLDVGCGVRFTMTLINQSIPIKSYTGIDVEPSLISYLGEHVQAHDSRFDYHHWSVYNDLYNRNGVAMKDTQRLPVEKKFDVIWLFSVFTHVTPEDADALLRILRNHIKDDGRLFFSAFISDNVERFEDRRPETPLLVAYFGRKYMHSLIERNGWRIVSEHERDPDRYIQNHFVCVPA